MTAHELAQRLSRTPLSIDPNDAKRIKLAFLLNLVGVSEVTFTDQQIMDARDALLFGGSRTFINDLLSIVPTKAEELAGPEQPSLMPVTDKPDLHRLLLFLRPDPRMLVEVEKKEANTEPHLNVFQVCIEDGRGGSWMEAFANEDTLRAFLRGIRVTFAMSDLQRLLPDFGDEAPFKFTDQSAVQDLP